MLEIPFNKPYFTGHETIYIEDAVAKGKISGNGYYTQKCQSFFQDRYGFEKSLLTTSCTDALEMAAILSNIGPGDEVIIPSFTFVSTALAFVRQGATIVFADSMWDNPNMDANSLIALITERTKAIVPVHYAGIPCDMDLIMDIARAHNIIVIEDAAQAIDANYKGKPLGTFGDMACFSFHETKNIICGEGGMLVVNNKDFVERAEIIWEKGTNRAQFFRGEVDKYTWVDTGSSFLPSEINAAFLWAQLENLDKIQQRRKEIWEAYNVGLEEWASSNGIELMKVPIDSSNNGHMFYFICQSNKQRSSIIAYLKINGIMAVTHYISLHSSPYYGPNHDGRLLQNSDLFTDRLLRLPFFYDLDVKRVVDSIKSFSNVG